MVVEIAVGVLKLGDKALISQRLASQDLAGYWEFPGGKVKQGEAPEKALEREFFEEVGIKTKEWQPIIQVPWQYKHQSVLLKFYQTACFSGEPFGKEGQEIEWCDLDKLKNKPFPPANKGLITALFLPETYVVTGDFYEEKEALSRIKVSLEKGEKLFQLRAKKMPEQAFISLANKVVKLVHQYKGAKVLLNATAKILEQVPQADGLQLPSSALKYLNSRPLAQDKLLGISTHSKLEIAKALVLEADFILLSPVKQTTSHPEFLGIGWENFQEIVKSVPIPVYALGGMKLADLSEAKKHGAQGIAAISEFWLEDR